MRIKPPPPDLSSYDQISEASGDKELAANLTQLLRNLEHSTVTIFDGRWGVGKTTFIRRWVSQLREEGVPSIYVDAFAVDYLESPFVALAGAFAKAGEEVSSNANPTYTAFVDAASKVGKGLGGVAAKISVKALTLGLIGSAEIKEIEELKDTVADALSETAEDAVKALIEDHAQKEGELESLRTKLSEFPRLLSNLEEGASEEVPPLVVIIDELDRCRPDFSLGMLETLKHFFGVNGIHFVLVTNREHLLLSVTHKYGAFASAHEYLRKFYDLHVVYDQNYDRDGAIQIRQRVQALATSLLGNIPERQQIADFVQAAAIAHRLTMRDLENVFLNLTVAYAAVRSNQFRPALMVTMLSLLKTIDPALYTKAKAGILTYDEFRARLLSQPDWGDLDIDRVRTQFQYFLTPEIDENDERFRGLGQSLWNFNIERTRVISYLCKAVIDRFAPAAEVGAA